MIIFLALVFRFSYSITSANLKTWDLRLAISPAILYFVTTTSSAIVGSSSSPESLPLSAISAKKSLPDSIRPSKDGGEFSFARACVEMKLVPRMPFSFLALPWRVKSTLPERVQVGFGSHARGYVANSLAMCSRFL